MMKAELIDNMGSDASIVKAARVSFANDKEVRTQEQDAKLIKYLADHNHWSPFSHVIVTLRMTAPIPIRTQCFKTKVGMAENEESRRYVSYTPEYFTPKFRVKIPNKKQGSGEAFQDFKQNVVQQIYQRSVEASIKTYEELLAQGVAEEQARFVLPQGCLVNWYWTGSLAAFARFYKQRTDPHAQLEIQELAQMVGEIIKPLYPLAWEALTCGN